jgi:hypothetical protein
VYSQIFVDKGAMKENKPGDFGSGRLNRILRPRFKNGFVISITFDRAKLIVNEA